MTRKDDESLTRRLQPWIRRTAIAAATLAAYAAATHRPAINRQVKAAVNGLQVFSDAALTRTLDHAYRKVLETPDPEEAEDAFTNFAAKGAQRFEVSPPQLQYMIDPEKVAIAEGYIVKSRIPGITVVMTHEVSVTNSIIDTRQQEYYAVRFTTRRFRGFR